jgi:hypothetical protein
MGLNRRELKCKVYRGEGRKEKEERMFRKGLGLYFLVPSS